MTDKKSSEVKDGSYLTRQFRDFFSGSRENYGLLQNIKGAEKGEKVSGSYVTITDTPLTIERYKDHLRGTTSLGIIPLDEENFCKFGVIDIDIYNLNFSNYVRAIERENLPLITFLSKSGGIHLYLFLKDKVPATDVRDIMKRFATTLSLDKLSRDRAGRSLEIFPKQVKLTKGKTGSFINLPYFHAEVSKQVAIRSGEQLSLTDAIHYMEQKKISLKDVHSCLDNIPFVDAPPCLQSLYLLNPFGEGVSGRNNYLFSFGVYFKKKEGELFNQSILNLNESLFEPLNEREIEDTIIPSLLRKDYGYRCTESPCLDYCNKERCKTRDYGVGKENGFFSIVNLEKLTQYKMKKPYYTLTISCRVEDEEKQVEIRFDSALELDNQDHFRASCVDTLHIRPSKLKRDEWIKRVDSLLEGMEIVVVDTEDDVSRENMIIHHIKEFILGRSFGDKRSHIKTLGKTFYDESRLEYIFDLTYLYKYLDKQLSMRQALTNGELSSILRDMGAVSKVLKNELLKSFRAWVITEDDLGDTSKFSLDDVELDFDSDVDSF